jgi:hypothetical protein
VPKQHEAQIPCGPSANCWRHREKYPAESSKMMKLKGFRYIAGYCLSSKACTQLSKERKLFLFWLPEGALEVETWKKLSSFRGDRASEKAPVLWIGEMD